MGIALRELEELTAKALQNSGNRNQAMVVVKFSLRAKKETD